MNTTKKILVGLSIASGALLAAWLMTGDRGQKVKNYIVRRSRNSKEDPKKEEKIFEDSDVNYV